MGKQWNKSATVVFRIEEVQEVNRKLQQEIADRQELLKNEKMTFEQSIQLTKKNYILLRLRKRYFSKSRGQKKFDCEFSVVLDKEEHRIFKICFNRWNVKYGAYQVEYEIKFSGNYKTQL